MYQLSNDQVQKCEEIPTPEVGAPSPFFVGREHSVVIGYFISKHDPRWEERYTTIWTDSDEKVIEECNAIVRFDEVIAHYFGKPSEETIPGHPLYDCGLERFTAYEVIESSWIKAQKKMDSVSPGHGRANFNLYRHYFIGFHDSSVECIAKSATVKIQFGDISYTDLSEFLNES